MERAKSTGRESASWSAVWILLMLAAVLGSTPLAHAQWRHIPTDSSFIPLQVVGDTIIGYKTSARQVNYSMDAGLTWHYGIQNAWPVDADVEFLSSPADWRWVYLAKRGGNRDTVLRTRDGGEHFDTVLTNGPGGQWTTPTPVFVSPKSAAKLYGYEIGCLRSDDSGGTWRDTHLYPAVDNVANLYDGGGFAIDQSDTARLYEEVSGSERSFWYYSSDGGETWDEWTDGGGSKRMVLTAGIPRAGCIVRYDFGQLTYSSNNGRSWDWWLSLGDIDTSIAGQVPYPPESVVFRANGGTFAVCLPKAIAYTMIGASSGWRYLNLPEGVIGGGLDPISDRIVLIAHRGSILRDIWIYDAALTSVVDDLAARPAGTGLHCYPQPVRAGEAMIISSAGRISRIRLYDLLGCDLTSAMQSRQVSTSVWSITLPRDATGSYLIESASPSGVQTQRISVLR